MIYNVALCQLLLLWLVVIAMYGSNSANNFYFFLFYFNTSLGFVAAVSGFVLCATKFQERCRSVHLNLIISLKRLKRSWAINALLLLCCKKQKYLLQKATR